MMQYRCPRCDRWCEHEMTKRPEYLSVGEKPRYLCSLCKVSWDWQDVVLADEARMLMDTPVEEPENDR